MERFKKGGDRQTIPTNYPSSLMLENGADIRFIQAILGHAKLETTEIYTHVSIRQLKAIHESTHPARMHSEAARELRAELEDMEFEEET